MRSNIKQLKKRFSILVTAGPTREKIDTVRFISNYSTGTFGYEIAREAKRRGHRVTLISGPTRLKAPQGVKLIRVESALDMRRAVKRQFRRSDCLIMAAAVSDWRVLSPSRRKIKRNGAGKRLELVENPDILYELSRRKRGLVVGFALETEKLADNALRKLKEKNLDFIVANRLRAKPGVFGDNKTDILIIDRFGNRIALYGKTKRELAKIVLDKVLSFKI